MRYLKTAIITAIVAGFALPASADRFSRSYGNGPDIEIWTNKGYDATYYYGEDIAVYFRAESDCYVVIYDVDPSGEVSVLFPSNYYNSPYVTGGQVYRVPDYYSDYTLEVTYRSGTEHIFAVASYQYLDAPDFMRYAGYDYGDPEYYDDNYFVRHSSGELDDFVNATNGRIARGDYSLVHTRFFVQSEYRHHRHYRYWDYDPYNVGSLWVGSNFPGSEVWIDGIYFGIAPILVPGLYFGEHWVWIYYGGYPCYQRYFYLSSVERYYIDVRIDDGYKDYRQRRASFDGWRPLEKKYRNEDNFKERAREARDARIRAKALPAHVVRDFDERGIIAKDSPLARRVREERRADDGIRVLEKRQARKEIENRMSEADRERAARNPEAANSIDLKRAGEKDKSTELREIAPGRIEKEKEAKGLKETDNAKREEKREKSSISTKSENKERSKSGDSQNRKNSDSLRKSESKSKSTSKSGGSEKDSKRSSSRKGGRP